MKKRILIIGLIVSCLVLVALGAGVQANWLRPTANSFELKTETWQPFLETLFLLEENFYSEEGLDEKALMEEAIRGLLRATEDPYARYLDEDDYQIETSDRIEGEFSGLGIVVAIKDDWLTVISPYKGTPADRAGIQAGDVILEIDGEPTRGMSLDRAVKRLRGKRGTEVTLTIQREGVEDPLEITVVRDIIKIKSVEYEILSDEIGVLRILEFHGRTAEEAQTALSELWRQGVEGIVVDLRSNPGGLLTTAILTSGMFVPRGETLLIIEYKSGEREFISNSLDPIWNKPVVVLIDQGTASGAEIMAGVLRLKGVLLIGEKSFGKGVVQQVFPLSHGGGVIFTVSEYYLADGSDINGEGLVPDLIVETEEEQMKKAVQELERLLDETRAMAQ
ncbi:MAG: carboxyl-terminal processing protease [Candidatus Atribacteria bacterium]|nr:carboxyl-terminal processing protease [Candidatus Atribacteria bacterium]